MCLDRRGPSNVGNKSKATHASSVPRDFARNNANADHYWLQFCENEGIATQVLSHKLPGSHASILHIHLHLQACVNVFPRIASDENTKDKTFCVRS